MRRREFISLLGGAVAWPLAAHAQQPDRMRLIGVLSGIADEPSVQVPRYRAFLEGLKELGWTVGRNIRVEYRFGGGDLENTRRQAVELVALAPDVILATGTATER